MLSEIKLKDQHFKLREALDAIRNVGFHGNQTQYPSAQIADAALIEDTNITNTYTENGNDKDYFNWWVNREIPAWLDKFTCFEDFDKAMPSACASGQWKMVAYAMAKERWNVKEIKHIPR